jgi:acetylornithine deacetylase/succinyl-diaminopimelate desuccinylase-like protein
MNALVDDIVALAQTPAPTFSEELRLQWLERRLARTPGRRERDAAGNLVWSWGEGRPRVVVAAHVDTVFPPGTELQIRHDDGHLVGPGVGDNAAAVAVAVHVVESLLAEGPMAPGAVAFTVGEEGLGNLKGAIELCRSLAPEAFIALEGHGLDQVLVDAVGSVRARVTVRGPGGHAWEDRGTPSAIDGLVELAARLRKLGTPVAPVNVGTISGGRSVNTIADHAEFLVERRAVKQPALDVFADTLGDLRLLAPLAVATDIVGRRPAGHLDREAPLLAAVLAVRRRLGLPPALGEGSTDANAALAAGIPALCLGVARGESMHALHEWIDRSSLADGSAQLKEVLRALL